MNVLVQLEVMFSEGLYVRLWSGYTAACLLVEKRKYHKYRVSPQKNGRSGIKMINRCPVIGFTWVVKCTIFVNKQFLASFETGEGEVIILMLVVCVGAEAVSGQFSG